VTTPPIQGTELRITAQNRAPSLGTLQTPVWFGLHNGTFDFVDVGSPSSPEFERLAEDGNVEPLGGLFSASSSGTVSGVIASPGGPLAPGATATVRLRVDPSASTNRYFSWASMVIPSNDAFVATDDPMETELFDAGGSFVGAGFTFPAARIYDAGTEVNDEIPANTAAFGQATPDTGTTEVANVGAHPGFLAPGMGGILDDMNFAGADFANVVGYETLRFDFGAAASSAPTATGSTAVRLGSGDSATVDVRVANLSGAATAVTLRNASAGSDGPILADLTSAATTSAEGDLVVANETITIDQAFRDALAAGDVYVEVTTALNPAGEVRGQVATAP
ncbi:MAG: spondin domain-containing protein, partial [Planctomycetota bacterium]